MLLTYALVLSASQFAHKKKPLRIYTSIHSGGLELAKLTYTRLEDSRGGRFMVYRLETALSDTQRASDVKGQPRQTPGNLLSKLTDLTTTCWQSVLYHNFHIDLHFYLKST